MDEFTQIQIRVAQIEAEMRGMHSACDAAHARAESERERLFAVLDGVTAKLLEIQKELVKYKGVAGGALFVVSGLWALFVTFKDKIWS